MRKFFLIIMMFLLPYQYAWAVVEAYDMHDSSQPSSQISEAHFGHHVDCDNLTQLKTKVGNKESQEPVKQDSGKHVHCGFCNFSYGGLLTYSFPVFEATSVQFLSHYSLVYHSPTFNTLDRPKWLQPI